ncbi:MAG: lysylphosphatidylglycerol synthase transmembrane domain-containing protein [Verrucomicrobia bacterium]|nr:lysylphosphatidylglycerol synthase transmembrane domain-containing protein [Verrucomicrobiota bacterium]
MVETKPTRSILNRLAPWIRLGVTVGILAFLAGKVNWTSLAQRFTSAHPGWLVAALLVTFLSISLCATRFWFLLRLQKIPLPYFRAVRLTFVGFFFNLFLIGSTGGDAVRIYYLLRWFPHRKARATLTILLDRIFGIAALFGLALLLLSGTADRLRADATFAPLANALPWLGPLGAFLLLLAFILPGLLPNLPLPQKLPGRAVILDLLHSLRDTMHGGWNTVGAVIVGLSVHLASFAGATLLARSLDLPINYPLAGLILVLVFTASALPISVSGHGVREGVMVFLFLHLGISSDPAAAIAYSLLIYGLGLFWSLFGGLAYLTLKSSAKIQ